MALSWQETTASAGQTTVAVNIDYLKKTDIYLEVNDVTVTGFTWDSDKVIRFPTTITIAAGDKIGVIRRTQRSELEIEFAAGAAFNKANLDEQNTQFLYLAQELVEGKGIDGFYGDISMNGYKITSVGAPTANGDVVNKLYADTLFGRTLRVPEGSVAMLPNVAMRKNCILGFNSAGAPSVSIPVSGSAADVLIKLADTTGAEMIGTSDGTNVQADIDLINATYQPKAPLNGNTGFQYIGQVDSYATLRTIVPSYAGQTILLQSYSAGWAAQGHSPKGGGQFVAINAAGTDDGGTVAVVNANWYWRRIVDHELYPEMFGADGYATNDSATAIQTACNVAAILGINKVIGHGKYLINSGIAVPAGAIASPSGGDARFGFTLDLNVLIVNPSAWASVPDKFWDAAPAVYPADNLENGYININEFDGGGKATGFSTVGKSCSTSRINIGLARNYIIGFRNWGPVSSQGTMTYVTGNNWQNGYLGVLIGTNGSTNFEAHNIDINWCANHRAWGVGLQDRTQYSHVKGGTYDFNGKWMSRLTLTNISSDTGSEVFFGSSISNGTITRYAMSNVLNDQGTAISGSGGKCLFVMESSSRIKGASDFTVGDTITCGTWSATISAIQVTTDANPYIYFDIVSSNRSGDFSKSNITASYIGGLHGHNLHTNFSLTNNSTTTVEAINIKGLGIATDNTTMALYAKNLLGYVPFGAVRPAGITWNIPHIMGSQRINGSVIQVTATNGTPIVIAGFGGAASDLTPDIYEIFVSSNQSGCEGMAMVTVTTTTCRVAVTNVKALGFAVSSTNPLQITAVTSGTDALLTAHITKR